MESVKGQGGGIKLRGHPVKYLVPCQDCNCCINTVNEAVTKDENPCQIFGHPMLQLCDVFAIIKIQQCSLITWAFLLNCRNCMHKLHNLTYKLSWGIDFVTA